MKRNNSKGRLLAGILAAVIMVTSAPEVVYAAEQAGRTEQDNSAWVEDGINADEKFDNEEEIEVETSDEKNDIEDENNADAANDKIDKDDENGEEIPDQDNVSGEENESEMPDEKSDSEELDAAEEADSSDNAEVDDTVGEEDLEAEFENTNWLEEDVPVLYTVSGVENKVNELRSQYKNGLYWHRVNGENTVTEIPCPHAKTGNTDSCGYYNNSYQCMAFASKIFYDIFGENVSNRNGNRKDVENIMVGDYVRISGHSFVVVARSGNIISAVECNYGDDTCRIKWDNQYNISQVTGFYHASNYDTVNNTVPLQPVDRVKGSYMDTGYDQVIPDGYYHIASSFGDQWWLTIAEESNGDGANVNLWDYSSKGFDYDGQLFYFQFIDEGDGRGFYKIMNKKSGKCLSVAGGSEYMYDENGNPTNVIQWVDNGTPEQQWAVKEIDGGDKGVMYTLQARCSGFFLDLYLEKIESGANISLHSEQGSRAQQWRLVPYAPAVGQTIGDGEYQIVCHEAENKAVGAAGNTCGANVELSAAYKGNYRQTFDVEYIGDGYYSIVNKYSGLSLDVAGHSRTLGTNVWLWDYIDYDNDYDAQKWIIKPCGNGYYNIISKCNGLYLNLENGDSIAENNISMWNWNSGGTNQMWKFVSYVPKLEPPTVNIPSGTEVEAGTSVSLLSGVNGAAIYYTLDGTNPSKESFHYTKPFIIEKDTVITAYVVKDGYEDSDPAVFTYTVKSQEDYGKGDVLDEDIPQGKVENIPQGLWMSAVSSQIYTGKAIKPQVRVYDYKTLLTEKKDYTISYKNNVKANIVSGGNVPTITVTGKGNYTGKEVQTFVIRPKCLSDVDIMADDITLQYNGQVQKSLPVLTWNGRKLTKNKDYTVSYPNEESDGVADPMAYIKTGTYTILVKGMGNYTGEKTINLTITQSKSASTMTVAKIVDHTYTGAEVRPVPVVKSGKVVLTEGDDYEVSYQNNINVGTATVMISGKGSYAGVKKVTFKIVPRASLNKARAELEFDSPLVYTGRTVRPDRCRLTVSEKKDDGRIVTVTLTEGTDYEVSYRNDSKAGTATIIFQGINGYSGTLKKTYKIAPYDIGKDETDLAEAGQKIRIELADSYAYVKGGCKPEPVVTYQGKVLTKGTDYTLSYRNCNGLNDGSNPKKRPAVIVKGKGCFKGTREKTYRITSKEIGRLTMTAADRVWQNKGNIYKTKIVIKDENGKNLIAGKDYDSAFTYEYNSDTVLSDGTLRHAGERVTAQDIISAGTVIRVTAAAKGRNYSGTVSCAYRITKADIGKAVVTIPTQTYTGRAIKPENEIRIKLNGQILPTENYKITGYSNNINKGTATVTISGINDCGGTKTAKFKIKGKGLLWWWR